MKALRRHAPRALLGIAVSATLLYFAFRHADLGDVAGVIRGVPLGALVLAVAANMGLHLVTALKWRWIARGAFEGKVRHFFGAVAIGEMSSNVLPVRLDEPLRAWWLHRKAGAPAGRIFGTIVLDRIFELIAIVMLLVWVLAGLPTAPDWVREGAWILGAVLAASMVAVAIIVRRESGPGTTRVGRLLHSLKDGLAALPGLGERTAAVGLALLQFVFHALCFHFVLRAVGADLSPQSTALAVLASHLSFAIPSGPSAVGAFEYVQTQVLMSQGLDLTMATAAAILVHAILAIPITLVGVAFFAREPLRGALPEETAAER